MRSYFSLLAALVIAWSTVGLTVVADGSELAAVRHEAERGGYLLMEVDELREKYSDGETDLLLIDTRQDWEYRTGSIEGAIHFSMEPTWFSRLIQRGALAQALGPDKERVLVFY